MLVLYHFNAMTAIAIFTEGHYINTRNKTRDVIISAVLNIE